MVLWIGWVIVKRTCSGVVGESREDEGKALVVVYCKMPQARVGPGTELEFEGSPPTRPHWRRSFHRLEDRTCIPYGEYM